ncbi:MAG TPA: DinB family protein [Pyrinomonadaceae bacterium]|nr:DinB family protein [Pyrinomonadaceae bacterium]
MSAEIIIGMWKDVRNGLISEVEQIPEDHFSFRATPETRSVAEILQHIIETQKILVGESCRDEANIRRQSFADHHKEHAAGVKDVTDKQGLIDLLRSSMDAAEECVRAHGERINEPMISLDGRQSTKAAVLTFASSHEMYHRGQLTVYERLMNIEPVLTGRLKKLFAQAGASE